MKPIEQLFCKSALNMTPYSPIEPPDQIAKRLGLNEDSIIKLDANENPFGTSPAVIKALSAVRYYHIYPDPAQVQLRESIAKYAGVNADMIIAGTGADEIIDIVCRLVLEQGEKVLGFTPTFSYYSHVVALNKGQFLTIPRESDYSIDMNKVRKIDLQGCKLVILCSPNNPSGNLLEEEVLDYFLGRDIIVMVDEAYYEFSKISFKDKVRQHQNLIVLRTFSKCFGLAGLRVGYGIASSNLIDALMKIKPPFSVNVAAEAALKTCLDNLPYYQEQVDTIIQVREWSQDRLREFKQLTVHPSQSNFILCEVRNYRASTLAVELEKKGVLIRYFATKQLESCIRISVGTREQMEAFLKQLKSLIQ
ncbi:histidinol-phosphate transaminase [bacterium]|nr:histidinol-phosphate transaminase [bacterium]